jgi:glutaredoxin
VTLPIVTVYGSACPACVHAKAVLDRHGIGYAERPLAELPARFGRPRTMPQIVVDGELVGGADALLRVARSGALARLARGERGPWATVHRRLGRGYVVVVRDDLGRALERRRARSRAEADALARTAGAGRPRA